MVQALVITLLACTKETENVLIITPAYKKFIEVVRQLNRNCLFSKMINIDGRY